MTTNEINALIAKIANPTADQKCLITEIRFAVRRGSLETASKLAAMLNA